VSSSVPTFADLPEGVRETLEPHRHRVTLERGKKHLKVRIDGILVCVCSRGSGDGAPRLQRNAVATIRRWLRGLKP
jgi:hypothetical protein